MKSRTQMLIQEIIGEDARYPDFLVEWGITRHCGGLQATDELAHLCRISAASSVLHIGCGVGFLSCYLARRYGCAVTGIDIAARRIDTAQERAQREGVDKRVTFRVADARDLPFPDRHFDAVIGESVNAFIEEKKRAVREYVRVTKPGGHVGFTETTWIRTPYPAELVAYLYYTVNARIMILEPEAWKDLLESSGLTDVTAHTYHINRKREIGNQVRLIGLAAFLRAWTDVALQYVRYPSHRTVIRKIIHPPAGYFDFVGYGVYAGRKQDAGGGPDVF